jgi:hypothetical protein
MRETNINYLTSKDALFRVISVPLATPSGTEIGAFAGNPMYCNSTFVAAAANVNPIDHYRISHSPLSYISNMFEYWSGDLLLRIKLLKTAYHRGRLRITYEPAISYGVTTDASLPMISTHIIDIGESDEFVFNIPFITNKPVLKTGHDMLYVGTTTAASVFQARHTDGLSNPLPDAVAGSDPYNGVYGLYDYSSGIVRVYTDSVLNAPGASDAIRLLCYISAAPNFKLTRPVGLGNKELRENPSVPTTTNVCTNEGLLDPRVAFQASMGTYGVKDFGYAENDLISETTGEYITDLKQLLHQYNRFRFNTLRQSALTTFGSISSNTINGVPHCGGYYTNNIRNTDVQGQGIITNALIPAIGLGISKFDANFNAASYTDITTYGRPVTAYYSSCYLTTIPYVSAMFCGHRGDISWRLSPCVSAGIGATLSVTRAPMGYYGTVNSDNTGSTSLPGARVYGTQASNVVRSMNQGPLVAKSPYMSNRLFHTVDLRYRDGRIGDDSINRGLNIVAFYAPASGSSVGADGFLLYEVAASSNYEPLYFLNTPYTYRATGNV